MSERDIVPGATYRSAWSSKLRVEIVSADVEVRLGAINRRRAVLYRRLDKPGECLAVRSLSEFLRTFSRES